MYPRSGREYAGIYVHVFFLQRVVYSQTVNYVVLVLGAKQMPITVTDDADYEGGNEVIHLQELVEAVRGYRNL